MLIDDFLTEGRATYEAMFRGILSDPDIPDDNKKWVRDRIKWAQQTLRKSDRVIWFLRYIKATMMDAFAPPETNPLPGEKWVATFDPDCLKPYAAWGIHSFHTKGFWDKLEHFMSLDCPAIQNMTFGKKPVADVMTTMRAFEKEWGEEQKGRIPADHPNNAKATTIIDFGNGWVWMNLNAAACNEEGRAMGHCGNSPRYDTDDTIVSLRKKIMKGGALHYEPHLTFTMTEVHELMERKGRANAKPAARYHEMIVALLLKRIGEEGGRGDPLDYYITGLIRGSWEPENDFQIADLSPALRTRVLNERPELGNAVEYWEFVKPENLSLRCLRNKLNDNAWGLWRSRIEERPTGRVVIIPIWFGEQFTQWLGNDLTFGKPTPILPPQPHRHSYKLDILSPKDEAYNAALENHREEIDDLVRALNVNAVAEAARIWNDMIVRPLAPLIKGEIDLDPGADRPVPQLVADLETFMEVLATNDPIYEKLKKMLAEHSYVHSLVSNVQSNTCHAIKHSVRKAIEEFIEEDERQDNDYYGDDNL